MTTFKERVRALYYGGGRQNEHFRYGLLALDTVAVMTFFAATYLRHSSLPASYSFALFVTEIIVGVFLLAGFLTRMWVSGDKYRFITQSSAIIDFW